MKKLKVEYLAIIDTSNSFCDSINSFNNLLMANSDITINSKLKHNHLDVDYEVQSDKVKEGEQRFFHIKLTCNDVCKISGFESLLKAIRTILFKASGKQPQVLWDDVSFYYANAAYPKIHEIENLMRKLITKFMLTNVGLGWVKSNTPNSVKNSIGNKSITEVSTNYLYETDFIQLANFLFDDYVTKPTNDLMDKIEKIMDINELNLEDLKRFIPKSNWERYFSSIVDCEDVYLKSRWKNLYELRCKVAHNNILKKEDFELICVLVADLKAKLEIAIDNLDKVHLSDESREVIAENAAIQLNTLYGEYIQEYKKLEKLLYEVAEMLLGEAQYKHNLPILVRKILEQGYLSKSVYSIIREINLFRNIIVHDPDAQFSPEEVKQRIVILRELHEKLSNGDEMVPIFTCKKCLKTISPARDLYVQVYRGQSLCMICRKAEGNQQEFTTEEQQCLVSEEIIQKKIHPILTLHTNSD